MKKTHFIHYSRITTLHYALIFLFLNIIIPPQLKAQTIERWEMSAEPGDQASSTATSVVTGLNLGILTRGAGVTVAAGTGGMNSTGWFDNNSPTTLAQAIANNKYYEFTVNIQSGFQASVTAVSLVLWGNTSGPNTAVLRSSADGFTNNLSTVTINTAGTLKVFSIAPILSTGILTFRVYCFGAAISGTPSPTGAIHIGPGSANPTDNDLLIIGGVGPACTITATFSGSPSACNDNGTPNDPSDDFFTQNVSASFFNRPITGSLQIVPGGDQIGTYSILSNQISGNSHVFNAVKFKADGTPSVIQMNFTDNTACIDAATGPSVQSCAAPPCTITANFSGSASACNDNGTPNDLSDDFFTQNVSASFFNRPITGSLQIVPGGDQIGTYSILSNQISGNSHVFNAVKFKADGTPSVIQMNFTDATGCIDEAIGPTVQSCSPVCDITSVSFQNISSCNDNGTINPSDDFFTANVVANFANPPATGNLQIEPGGDAISAHSIAVGSLVGNSHTFVGVKFKADGTQTVVEVEFTVPANQCVRTQTGPTVQPCSPVCDITSVSFQNISSCNDNGTINPSDDFFTANVVANFANPPATGNLQIEPGGDAISAHSIAVGSLVGNSHTFVGVKFKADGTQTVVEVEFTVPANLCTQTQVGPTVQPCSFLPPTITCPANVMVSCESQIPAPNISSVSETHACPGTATIEYVADNTSQMTCPNRFIMMRTYKVTDACGQTASCQQTITVNDQTPPSVLKGTIAACFATAASAEAAAIAATSATDNCIGALTKTAVTTGTCSANIIVTVMDKCGNSASVTYNTRIDNTPPSVIKGSIADCFLTIGAAETAAKAATTATDNCSGTLTKTVVTTGAFPFNIRVTVTDQCNNSAFVDYTLLDIAAKGGRVTLQSNTAATSIALCPSQNAVLIPINFLGKVAKWQFSPSTSSIWYDLPGTEGQQTLTVNGSTVSGTIFYRVVICSGGGVCTGQASVAFSNAFRITKKPNCTAPDGSILNTDITADNRLTIYKAYPNPAADFITFEIEHIISNKNTLSQRDAFGKGINDGIVQLDIMDLTGRVVQKMQQPVVEGFNTITLNILDLAQGIYLVRIKNNQNQVAVVKISKM